MSNPNADRPQNPPPGRTALVSMFPLQLDEPVGPDRPAAKPENRATAKPDAMNAGK